MDLKIIFIVLTSLGIFAALSASFLNLTTVQWGLSELQSERKQYSKSFHRWSWLLRFFVGILIFSAGMMSGIHTDHVIFISLVYCNVAFTGYNLVYNFGMKHSWYYTGSKTTGTGSLIDKLLGKGVIVMEALLLVYTILWYLVDYISMFHFLVNRVREDWLSFLVAAALIVIFYIAIRKFYLKK